MPDNLHTDFSTLPALTGMPPILLGEMDGIKLMNRIDTKYLTNEAVLRDILGDAFRAGYRALVADGARVSPYDSLYFDTAALKMFLDHHNRRLTRQKIRTRVYCGSGDTFLEVKRKNNKGRTKKKRLQLAPELFGDFTEDPAACSWLAEKSAFTAAELSPSLETIFRRITLVNPAMTERLTVDTALRFRNPRTGREASLGDAVIIELKQDGRAMSPMKGILLDRRVKPVRISKYCIGITLTDRAVKSNRFKAKIRTIQKTIHSNITVI